MNANFELYAKYYDALYRDKNYGAEMDYVRNRARLHAPKPRDVLDLGCGTGGHAFAFAGSGIPVLGVDVSPIMIEIARQRQTSHASLPLQFIVGDVRSFRAKRKFDLVVSLFHVLSYQLSNDDVIAAFETARAHMHEHSIFCFDFWYGPAVLRQRPEVRIRRLTVADKKAVRLAEPQLIDSQNRVDVHFTLLTHGLDSTEQSEIAETHSMRYFFLPEIDLMLRSAGLLPIETTAWMSDEAPTDASWAAVIVARKAA